MLLAEHLKNCGDLNGVVYDLQEVGDGLEMHNHTEEDAHITVVARGRLKVIGSGWEKEIGAGQIMNFLANQPHELRALEPNTRIINIVKKHGGVVNDGAKE